MGNTLGCTTGMTDYLIKENIIYQLRYVMSVLPVGVIWYFFLRNLKIPEYQKHIIIPILIYIFVSYVVDTLLEFAVKKLFIGKTQINEVITKCRKWQSTKRGLCDSSYQGVCYVNPDIIIDWDENEVFI
jgi:hypothetical protein